jgi:hypothetical protein
MATLERAAIVVVQRALAPSQVFLAPPLLGNISGLKRGSAYFAHHGIAHHGADVEASTVKRLEGMIAMPKGNATLARPSSSGLMKDLHRRAAFLCRHAG